MKYIRPTISDCLTTIENNYYEDIPFNYIFSKEEKIIKNQPTVFMALFMPWEQVKELSMWAIQQSQELFIVISNEVSVKEVRQFTREICGESPVYICADGIIAAPALKKGFTLALTLPIYNEAETIADVIESFSPVVDEIVIGIDDKSNDGSKEICLRYTDDVFDFKWKDSFCDARNLCMDRCKSQWIFMTEGHETLQPASYPPLLYLSQLPDTVALVNVKRVIAGKTDKYSVFPWITKNIPECRYIYDSHNAIISTHKEVHEQVNMPQISTYHWRSEKKEDERTQQRRIMNRKNLLKRLLKNDRDSRALFYLGNEYFSFKEPEKAVEYYRRYLQVSDFAEERYEAKINLARCLKILKRVDEALEVLHSCFNEPVPRNDHMVYLAEHYIDKKIDLAIYYLKMAATVEEPVSTMWIEQSFYKDYPLKRLCSLYTRVGRLQDALNCISILEDKFGSTKDIEEIKEQILDAMNDSDKNWDLSSDKNIAMAKI